MQFYYPSLGVLPKSFGWLTEAGILYAQVQLHVYYRVFIVYILLFVLFLKI